MSCWDILCGPTLLEAPTSRRQNQQHQCRRFRYSGQEESAAGMVDYERVLYQPQLLPGMTTATRTDADGRFMMSGFGRNRLAMLSVSAPSVVDTKVTVTTRDMPDIGVLRDFNGKPTQVIHGATFTRQLERGLTITGLVRDRETNSPIPGMWVTRYYDPLTNSPISPRTNPYVAEVTPVTDKRGRFTISGLDSELLNWEEHHRNVIALPRPGGQYAMSTGIIGRNSAVIIECARGIPFRLKLVNEHGDAVEADVKYHHLNPNPFVADLAKSYLNINGSVSFMNRAARRANGTYEGFVLPGPGAVLVKTPVRAYRADRVDPKAFFAPGRTDWTGQERAYGTHDTLTISEGQHDQDDYAAIVLVNPTPNSPPLPRPRKNELIRCVHFAWRLLCRDGVWYADGRSNRINVGRHTLATRSREEAISRLPELDQRVAEKRGLAPQRAPADQPAAPLSLIEGRRLYDEHLARPRSTGGVKPKTRQKYKSTFDKFIPFAESQGVFDWRAVDSTLLTRYATYLEKLPRSHKSQVNELTTVKQTIKWFIAAGHLPGKEPIHLPLKKAESQRAYCWRPEQVARIAEYCRANPKLAWIGDVVIALACTGMRISELAALRWGDVDLQHRILSLPDETGYAESKDALDRRDRKSGRSRSFPIHPDLLEALVRQKHRDAYVFHGPRGGRLKPDYVRVVLINKVIAKLTPEFPAAEGERGFAEGRLHSFRHYFCSLCANNNVPERMVMEWLGHKDSAMVRHYYHLHDTESRRQMDRLNPLGNVAKRDTG
ncbi:MAG: site-specific integrase [Pirellulales bacterium]